MSFLSTVSSFIQNGGAFMYIILGTAVLIIAIALERFWALTAASSLNGGKLLKTCLSHASRGDVSEAAKLSRQMKTPVGRVAYAILSSDTKDEDKLQNAADGAAMVVLPPLSRRLPYLSALANVATLLGLLGTIFGLITAFSAVNAADPSQRSAFLAAGISQALNTTAFGLIIAVPTLLLHGFLVAKVEGVAEQVDEMSVRLIRGLTGRDAI